MTANKTRRFGTLGLLALAAMLAFAPMARAQMKGSFTTADANHDGQVTLPEFEAYATQMLANANGFRAQRFKAMTPQQQQAILQKRFAKMDQGNKGYLNQSDWPASS
jgi:Ca2+-binding EF-hand superfamily protein